MENSRDQEQVPGEDGLRASCERGAVPRVVPLSLMTWEGQGGLEYCSPWGHKK